MGEFHLYDSANADGPTAMALMKLARERACACWRMWMPWRWTGCWATPRHSPHLGPTPAWAASRCAACVPCSIKHPGLRGELSYRPGLTVDGRLSDDWRALLTQHAGRFP